MNFANMDFGLYKGLFGSSSGGSASSSSGDATDATAKLLHNDEALEYAQIVYVVSDGRPPEEYFREIVIGMSLLFGVVAIALLGQFVYVKRQAQKTPGMIKQLNAYRGMIVTVGSLCYYAGLTTAMFALSLDGLTSNDILIALLIILFLGVPLPLLATMVYMHHRRIKNKDDKETQEETERLEIIYGSLIGGQREGCEWYAVLSVWRKFTMAASTAFMMDLAYEQCWVIAVIYQICFFANVIYAPYEGGYKSLSFRVDVAGQVLQLVTCYVPIYYAHTSNIADEGAGLIVMVCQLAAILITIVVSIPGAIQSFKDWRRARKEKAEYAKTPQGRAEKSKAMLRKKDSWIGAAQHKARKSTKHIIISRTTTTAEDGFRKSGLWKSPQVESESSMSPSEKMSSERRPSMGSATPIAYMAEPLV